MRLVKYALTATFLAAIFVACGGEAAPANSPKSSPDPTPQAQTGTRDGVDAAGLSPPENANRAWAEFQQSHGEFDATKSDCALACKALASMDRAAGEVCSLDAERCSAARDTVKNARKRVRAECSVCANGASVDPDAPVPAPKAP